MGILNRARLRLWEALTPQPIRAIIEATSTSRDANLREDGWVSLGDAARQGTGMDTFERKEALSAAYYYWHRDPYAGRGVQLLRDYVFGRGIGYKATDPRVKAVLDRYWETPRNRVSITRAQAQWELQERLTLAGEVFFLHFVNRYDGSVATRIVEPQEIPEDGIISAPGDWRWPLYYKREWYRRNFSTQTLAYTGEKLVVDTIPDWNNLVTEGRGRPEMPRLSTVGTPKHLVCMHHLHINNHGQRGVSLLKRVLPWIKAGKGFMEDRGTLTLALAKDYDEVEIDYGGVVRTSLRRKQTAAKK